MLQEKLRNSMGLGTQKLPDKESKRDNREGREGGRDDWSEEHCWQSGVLYNAKHMVQSKKSQVHLLKLD